MPRIVPEIRQLKKNNKFTNKPILQSNGNVRSPPANISTIYISTKELDNHKFKVPLPFSPKMKVTKTSPIIQKTELIHQQPCPVMPKKNTKSQPKGIYRLLYEICTEN